MEMDEVPETAGVEVETSRRGLLTTAAMAAAVATVAGLAMSKETALAGSGNGVNMTQGAANINASVTTSLAGGSTFKVINGQSDGALAFKSSILGTQGVNNSVGVTGFNIATTGGRGVWGLNQGNGGAGVYGEHAESTRAGTGVIGVSNAGVGVIGSGTNFDLQGTGSGRLNLKAGGVSTPPAGSLAGTLASDASGALWWSPSNGVFQMLFQPVFHSLAPGRVYDSRQAAPSTGILAAGANRTISVADRRDANLTTGAVVQANFVPAGATAVSANVTITQTSGSGYLTVNPGGNTTIGASTINWSSSNQDIANGIILTLDASRQLTIVGGGGGSTHFIIDVNGYFL